MALTDKLVAIGDAIRSKTGGTEAMTLDAMAAAITNLSSGGGGGGTLTHAVIAHTTGGTSYAYRTFDLTEYITSGTIYFITQYGSSSARAVFVCEITDGVVTNAYYSGSTGSIVHNSAAGLTYPKFALADGIMTVTGSGSSSLTANAVVFYVA